MQIVYISVHPAQLLETLEYVAFFMPFVRRAIVISPGNLIGQFDSSTKIKVTQLGEAEVLAEKADLFSKTDHHQEKSWLLRTALGKHSAIDEQFILSDDDYRPIAPVPFECFRKDGIDQGYYCYDLLQWPGSLTDYDQGLKWTGNFLQKHGYPTLCYSSHMPQIMRKSILAEAANTVEENTSGPIIADEWSIYFNFASRQYQDLVNANNPYRTLCWPPLPTDWPIYVEPEGLEFENFYPFLYRTSQCFHDLPTALDKRDWGGVYTIKLGRRNELSQIIRKMQNHLVGSKIFNAYNWIRKRYPAITTCLRPLLITILGKLTNR